MAYQSNASFVVLLYYLLCYSLYSNEGIFFTYSFTSVDYGVLCVRYLDALILSFVTASIAFNIVLLDVYSFKF